MVALSIPSWYYTVNVDMITVNDDTPVVTVVK